MELCARVHTGGKERHGDKDLAALFVLQNGVLAFDSINNVIFRFHYQTSLTEIFKIGVGRGFHLADKDILPQIAAVVNKLTGKSVLLTKIRQWQARFL